MNTSLRTRKWLVQALTLSRLVATLAFASVAFEPVSPILVLGLYIYAVSTDLLDGYVSRKLKTPTYFGKVVDLVADKSLTIISLLYASARGIDFFPLALIAIRDVLMIGMRLITVDGVQLLPTSRVFGGWMAVLVWGNTLLLIYTHSHFVFQMTSIIYWVVAAIFAVNACMRIYGSRERIARVLQVHDPAPEIHRSVRDDRHR
jgi:phosphatidylglycerophosphate synthase